MMLFYLSSKVVLDFSCFLYEDEVDTGTIISFLFLLSNSDAVSCYFSYIRQDFPDDMFCCIPFGGAISPFQFWMTYISVTFFCSYLSYGINEVTKCKQLLH